MRDLNITSVIALFRAGEAAYMAEESKDSCDTNKDVEVIKMQNDMEEMEVSPLIQVKVLFFARARELTGLTEISLLMPPQSTAQDCMSKLLNKFPKLGEIYNSMVLALNEEYAPESMVLALNEEYAPESTILKNSDELAIIPPISGG